jgi:hypothetical protein
MAGAKNEPALILTKFRILNLGRKYFGDWRSAFSLKLKIKKPRRLNFYAAGLLFLMVMLGKLLLTL